jgi:hypothetical protein
MAAPDGTRGARSQWMHGIILRYLYTVKVNLILLKRRLTGAQAT